MVFDVVDGDNSRYQFPVGWLIVHSSLKLTDATPTHGRFHRLRHASDRRAYSEIG